MRASVHNVWPIHFWLVVPDLNYDGLDAQQPLNGQRRQNESRCDYCSIALMLGNKPPSPFYGCCCGFLD